MSEEFLIPFAMASDGGPIAPEAAVAGGAYRCPVCLEDVSYRRAHTKNGFPVRAHFAHHPESTCKATGERILHWAVELQVLAQVMDAATAVADWPRVDFTCPKCGKFRRGIVPSAFATTQSADIEYHLPSGLITDVCLLGQDGAPLFDVEVLVTHEVSDEKIAKLEIPWLELDATAYVESLKVWPCTRIGFDVPACPTCVLREQIRLKAVEQRAREAAEHADRMLLRRIEDERREAEDAAARARNEAALEASRPDRERLAAEAAKERADRESYMAQQDAERERKRLLESAYTDDEALAEFRKRGSMLLPSGAIVTLPGQNTREFRKRITAWMRLDDGHPARLRAANLTAADLERLKNGARQ